MRFAIFGRNLGLRLLKRGITHGVTSLLVAPVSIVRYFEFDFVVSQIPPMSGNLLDVSSPRLCALFVAAVRPAVSIRMMNPDTEDADATRTIISRLGISNVTVASDSVSVLADQAPNYDCVWSISVVEHIEGTNGDTDAMRLMYAALRPGGRLIVTVPVDRRFWVEYRDRDYYGVHLQQNASGEYFFQRLYDEQHVRSRLIEPLGVEPTSLSWFGERVAGTFQGYVRRWIEGGLRETVDDPRRVVDDYTAYDSWHDMPGFGVCGIVIDKPLDVRSVAAR